MLAAFEDIGDVFLSEVETADPGDGEAFFLGFAELVADGICEGSGSLGFGGAGEAGGFCFIGSYVAGIGGGYDFVVGDLRAELESVSLHWWCFSECERRVIRCCPTVWNERGYRGLL